MGKLKQYDVPKMKIELQALSEKLESHEKTTIAALEQITTKTLGVYFKGIEIPSLALGEAIIKRGNELIKKR